MDFTTEIEKGHIHLYCWENGRKVSDFVLEFEEARHLAYALLPIVLDNILEQYEDILQRLENNKPAPKMISADKVIEWLRFHIQVDEPKIEYNEDGQPLAESYLAHAKARYKAAEEVVKLFKEDFGL